MEDTDRFCGCCGDFPVMKGDDYYCELCSAIHHGTCDELARKYLEQLYEHDLKISEALAIITFMHERNCKIHRAGELDMNPCDCEARKAIKILEDLL